MIDHFNPARSFLFCYRYRARGGGSVYNLSFSGGGQRTPEKRPFKCHSLPPSVGRRATDMKTTTGRDFPRFPDPVGVRSLLRDNTETCHSEDSSTVARDNIMSH